jgi:hypothetical protein
MSSQTISQTFAEVEWRYRCAMVEATWGHLAPIKNATYEGKLIWAVGCFAQDELNPTVLVSDFINLDDSPWCYQATLEFVRQYPGNESGCVYEFNGIFRNYEFIGSVTCLHRYPAQLDPLGNLASYLQIRSQEGDQFAGDFLPEMLTADCVTFCAGDAAYQVPDTPQA